MKNNYPGIFAAKISKNLAENDSFQKVIPNGEYLPGENCGEFSIYTHAAETVPKIRAILADFSP